MNMETSMRLQGKTLLVTAAGQGIGRASAIACAREGADVVATDLRADLLESLAREAPTLRTRVLDVRDDAAVRALAAQLPPLDGLFNCAGFVHEGTILQCDEAAWDFSFDLNVKGAYRVTRAVLPAMLDKLDRTRGTAAILNMASMASSVKGFPNRFAYGATKAAVIGMTKALAADYVTRGLRCNALCPGTVDTPSLRGRIASAADPVAAEKAFIARQPMGRLATVDDITPQVVYLLSDESRFVSGQAVLVDGGVTI
jgi:2-keto-3-deoxy-L-fuconate dehydrogenase